MLSGAQVSKGLKGLCKESTEVSVRTISSFEAEGFGVSPRPQACAAWLTRPVAA